MNGFYDPEIKPFEFEGFRNQTGLNSAVRHEIWVANGIMKNESRAVRHEMSVANGSGGFSFVSYGTKCYVKTT